MRAKSEAEEHTGSGLEEEVARSTTSAAAEDNASLQLLKDLVATGKSTTPQTTVDTIAELISGTYNGRKEAYEKLRTFPKTMTLSEAVLERSRLEEVVQELVVDGVEAAQAA